MHCKKCDAVFHLDRTGKVVMGEPGQRGAQKAPVTKKSSDEPFATSFTELIVKSPIWVKLIMLGVLAFVGFQLAGVKVPSIGGKPLPKDLLQLSAFVGNAFVDEKPEKFKRVIAPGSEARIREWYDELRPQLIFTPPQRPGNMVQLTAYTDEATGEAIIGIMPPGNASPVDEVEREKQTTSDTRKHPKAAGYKHDGTFTLPTAWVRVGEDWKLDGEKTLDMLRNPPKSTNSR